MDDPRPGADGAPRTDPASGLDVLCQDIRAALEDGASAGRRVAALLRAYASNADCWRRWAHFVPDRYSRNLVYRCGDFELLLLCWGEGHLSPIHDHSGQKCWMAVLEGSMEEVHYAFPDGAARPMETGRVRRFEAGDVAYIHDDIALHLIRPAPGNRGVTLHLYADAIDACQVFDPRTGEATPVEVGYHSVRGVPCADRCPDEIRAEWARPGA